MLQSTAPDSCDAASDGAMALPSEAHLLAAAAAYAELSAARTERARQYALRRAECMRRIYFFKRRSRARLQLARMLAAAAAAIDGDEESARHLSPGRPVQPKKPRIVRRAMMKWRGSTLSGYLEHGDEKTYVHNFRMNHVTLELLTDLISKTGKLKTVVDEGSCLPLVARMLSVRDPPTLKFKVATCIFFLAHSGPIKSTADAASVGNSTVRRWLNLFYDAVIAGVKPKYMPSSPPPPSRVQAVHAQFAARRGIHGVAMACDGTHIPFRPKHAASALDYKNYKEWYSILAVAFVDSFYMFVDAEVGYPGRAGDNTVLRNSMFMAKVAAGVTAWLGEGGVILGDGGASDGDRLFLNPIPDPMTPEECWYNFCHSSTRFVVEEAFGRLKNRFRFLMTDTELSHKLQVKLIFLSLVLHNFCTFHKDAALEELPSTDEDPDWQTFFKKYERLSCPTCVRRNIVHCPHQAEFRNGKRFHHNLSGRPSQKRNAVMKQLWESLCSEPIMLSDAEVSLMREDSQTSAAASLIKEMVRRANTGVIHDV